MSPQPVPFAAPMSPQAVFRTPQPSVMEMPAGMIPNGAMTPSGRSSRHLAEWMAGTERELRELKWLFGSSVARVDGQHGRLMQELEKLHNQVDVWATEGSATGS